MSASDEIERIDREIKYLFEKLNEANRRYPNDLHNLHSEIENYFQQLIASGWSGGDARTRAEAKCGLDGFVKHHYNYVDDLNAKIYNLEKQKNNLSNNNQHQPSTTYTPPQSPPSSSQQQTSDSSCWIATAYYSDSYHPDVNQLRFFRESLINNRGVKGFLMLWFNRLYQFIGKSNFGKWWANGLRNSDVVTIRRYLSQYLIKTLLFICK